MYNMLSLFYLTFHSSEYVPQMLNVVCYRDRHSHCVVCTWLGNVCHVRCTSGTVLLLPHLFRAITYRFFIVRIYFTVLNLLLRSRNGNNWMTCNSHVVRGLWYLESGNTWRGNGTLYMHATEWQSYKNSVQHLMKAHVCMFTCAWRIIR